MTSTSALMENLPGRRNPDAQDAPAIADTDGGREPWFGSIAIAAGLAVTPLLIVLALSYDLRRPITLVSHTLPPGIDMTATASIPPVAAAEEPLERARLRLTPI